MKHSGYRLLTILATALALLVLASVALAGYRDNPPPQAGFTHSPLFTPDDSPAGHGELLSGSDIVRSSPVIGEIDGNTGNGLEIAVGGGDGVLYIYRSTGTLLRSVNVMPAGCTPLAGDYKINSAPAVGDLFGTGVPHVVIGYGTINQSDCDGGVVAYNGVTGALAWRYSLKTVSPSELLWGVVASPALADVDGDGDMEVGFGGLDRKVHLLNADGSARARYEAFDTSWSSPAFVNADADAALEMVIGTDITANGGVGTPNGGYVYLFDTHQRSPVDFGFGTGYLWRTEFDQAIFSSPAVGDILSTNAGLEVAIGASCFWPTLAIGANSATQNGRWIKILSLATGAVLQTLDAGNCVQSSPALGDIDDDGKLEVVATVSGFTNYGSEGGLGKIKAWDPDDTGTPLKWEATPYNPLSDANDGNGNDEYGGDLQSPIIADLDGNGSLEVLAANFWSVHVMRGTDGFFLTCQNTACGTKISMFAWFTLKSTPAVGDLDGDNDLEVVIGGSHFYKQGFGLLYVWTDLASAGLGSPAGTQPAYSAPWPMFRANAEHTGVFPAPPSLAATPGGVFVLHQQGDPGDETTFLFLSNGGTSSYDWTATTPAEVTLSPSSGTVTTDAVVTVTVDPSGYGAGTHNLGNITITATSTSGTVAGSPKVIPVTLFVGDVFKSFLPGILR